MTNILTQKEIDELLGDVPTIDGNYNGLIDLSPPTHSVLKKTNTTNYTLNKNDMLNSNYVKRKKTKIECRYCGDIMKNTMLYRQGKSINLLYCDYCGLTISNTK